MGRSILYQIRRKGQALAYRLTNPEFMSKFYFKIVLKQNLRLNAPQTFNEKIQHYKLHYCMENAKVITCTDKYRIRKYLQEKNLMDYAVPLLGVWERAEDIDWDTLPDQFVLKCNHGCAYNIICKDKRKLDASWAKRQLDKWMKEDFGCFNAEPHYSMIERAILCEEYLGDGKSDYLLDYKVHCFGGKPRFVLICSGRAQHSADYDYYDLDWNKLPYSTTKDTDFEKPESFETMIRISKEIAADFPFVRVDFYEIDGKPLIGELTFVPAGGLDKTLTPKADIEIGRMFDLDITEGK